MSRALPFFAAATCLAAIQPACAAKPGFTLQVVPEAVYKVDDPGNSGTSSFVFDIAVLCTTDCALTPTAASMELSDGQSTVERQMWTSEMLAKVKGLRYRILPNTPIESPKRMFTLPEAFDLHFYVRSPKALAIDSASVRLTVADARGTRAERIISMPIRYYRQKTALIAPFRGHGIVGQDWITNGGHGNVWNAFAVDLDGLDQNDGELNDADDNASDAGWGREILAPAAGTVVYARNDVPTNISPDHEPDDKWYMPLHDPVMAYAGNCVIIDHGNAEYSVMMHMQPGSVTVQAGNRVTAGQVIGKLGNSGDAFGPHLHYQLQAGPRLFHDQALPFRFQNIDVRQLARGTYFVVK